MSDTTQTNHERFDAAYKKCAASYEAWSKDQLNTTAREDLRKDLHELRKSLARVEIEMALSESTERAKNPIPIPANKAFPRKSSGEKIQIPIIKKKPVETVEDDDSQPNWDEQDDNALPGFLVGGSEHSESDEDEDDGYEEEEGDSDGNREQSHPADRQNRNNNNHARRRSGGSNRGGRDNRNNNRGDNRGGGRHRSQGGQQGRRDGNHQGGNTGGNTQ